MCDREELPENDPNQLRLDLVRGVELKERGMAG